MGESFEFMDKRCQRRIRSHESSVYVRVKLDLCMQRWTVPRNYKWANNARLFSDCALHPNYRTDRLARHHEIGVCSQSRQVVRSKNSLVPLISLAYPSFPRKMITLILKCKQMWLSWRFCVNKIFVQKIWVHAMVLDKIALRQKRLVMTKLRAAHYELREFSSSIAFFALVARNAINL